MVATLLVFVGCILAPEVYRARLDELDDDDGDGWSADAGDCDDLAADRFPGNAEVCDEVDNDCDDEVDEAVDTVLGYADGDGDGYGNAAAPVTGCAGTVVDDATDCDDDDASVHPGAGETCDGADQDCDGAIDDDATDALTGYPDLDGDGYGELGAEAVLACDLAGLAQTADDCDDTSAAVRPGAPERIDGVVNDCAAPAPLDEVTFAAADLQFTGPAGLGRAVWGPGDLDGDAQDDVVLATDEAVYLLVGPLASADATAARRVAHGFTGGLVAGRDLDGDLAADFAFGTAAGIVVVDGESRGEDTPAAWLTAASTPLWLDGERLVGASAAAVVSWGVPATAPVSTLTLAGAAAAARGDTDADGVAELWVGVPSRGLVLAFDAEGPALVEADASRRIADAEVGAELGQALALVGDTDGDGRGDVLVGAPGADGSGDDDGAAYLFVADEAAADAARATFPGRASDTRGGTTVAAAGDLDGDGYADFWVGGPQLGTAGVMSSVVYQLGPQVGVVTFRTHDGMISSDASGSALGSAIHPTDAGFLVGAPGAAEVAYFETRFDR